LCTRRLWGTHAALRRDFEASYTLRGYAIHHLSALSWSALHHAAFVSRQPRDRSLATRLLQDASTAGVACFVDYQLTPRRLQPGYEQQLSRKSLFLVYASFGLSIGLSTYLLGRQRRRA